jgi:hypothetical protein
VAPCRTANVVALAHSQRAVDEYMLHAF